MILWPSEQKSVFFQNQNEIIVFNQVQEIWLTGKHISNVDHLCTYMFLYLFQKEVCVLQVRCPLRILYNEMAFDNIER